MILSAGMNYASWGDLVLANFDYVVDGLVLQLQRPDSHPGAAPLLAALFRHAPLSPALLPALAEPAACAIQNLSILARHRRPQHTRAFLVAVRPIVAAAGAEGQALAQESTRQAHAVASQLEAQQTALFDELRQLEQQAAAGAAHNTSDEPAIGHDDPRAHSAEEYFKAHHGGEDGLAQGGAAERRERASKVHFSEDDHHVLHQRMARVASSSELAAAACQAAAPLLLAESLLVCVAATALVKARFLHAYASVFKHDAHQRLT